MFLLNNHYITKIAILVLWFVFPFLLSINALLVFDITTSIFLIYSNFKQKLLVNPVWILLFICIHYLVIYPFSNTDEIYLLNVFSIKIWGLMNVGIFVGVYLETQDIIYILKKIKIDNEIIKVFISFINFIPESFISLKTIMEAQKSRGLSVSLKNVFNLSVFKFIAIPYIFYTLRSIYYTSLNVYLKELKVSTKNYFFSINDFIIILFSISMIFWDQWISIFSQNFY